MGLNRRARRGIAAFNHIKNSGKNWVYSARRISHKPMFDANIIEAAQAAAEAINASVQVLPDQKNNPQPENPEGGAEQNILAQPEVSEAAPESSSGGAQ